MKIAVQKNHLEGQILYRSLDPSKKRRHWRFLIAQLDTNRSNKLSKLTPTDCIGKK